MIILFLHKFSVFHELFTLFERFPSDLFGCAEIDVNIGNAQAGRILHQIHCPFEPTKLYRMSLQMVPIVRFISYQVIHGAI